MEYEDKNIQIFYKAIRKEHMEKQGYEPGVHRFCYVGTAGYMNSLNIGVECGLSGGEAGISSGDKGPSYGWIE